jgi:hypothetical protein
MCGTLSGANAHRLYVDGDLAEEAAVVKGRSKRRDKLRIDTILSY